MTTTQLKKKHSARRKAFDFAKELTIDEPIKRNLTTDLYEVSIAKSWEDKQAAYTLAYESYLSNGYIREHPDKTLINEYDLLDSTMILIIKDQCEQVIATMTLIFGGDTKLPSSKVFALKPGNHQFKTVELSRFAVKDQYKSDPQVLYKLITWSYSFANYSRDVNEMVIEVNPKHVFFYKNILNFEVLSEEVPCPMVENAPAVLMRLLFSTIENALASNDNNKMMAMFCKTFCEEESKILNSLVSYHV